MKQQNAVYLIDKDQIIFCQTKNNYASVYMTEGNHYLFTASLTKLEKEHLSNDDFIRVSQSYLVNRKYIQAINKKRKTIELVHNPAIIHFTMPFKTLLSLIEKTGTSHSD
jgi:two-component system LytT family response regulator